MHQEAGSKLHGVHLELTGEDVRRSCAREDSGEATRWTASWGGIAGGVVGVDVSGTNLFFIC